MTSGGGVENYFPNIFRVATNQQMLVAVTSRRVCMVHIRRIFGVAEMAEWEEMQLGLEEVHLINHIDEVCWKLDNS
jgi:hypothetical protein